MCKPAYNAPSLLEWRDGSPPAGAAHKNLSGRTRKRTITLDMRIRSARSEDEEFVAAIAGEVFALYGDYRPLLPRWFRVPGVMTFISENEQGRTGYLMLAFFREMDHLIGDVLAIAVVPDYQNRGIGRMLRQHALLVCEQASERSPIRAVRLSVAHTNARARHLFESCGFQLLEGDFGTYEGGQKALHMECLIPLANSP